MWTARSTTHRTLFINGRFTGGRYHLESAHGPAPLSQPSDSRHAINLRRLSDDEFSWDTEVDYAIGGVTAAGFGAFISALLATAEGRSEHEVRAEYRAAIPRGSTVLGELFTMDSIGAYRLSDGSTLATFAISLTPSGLEPRYPNFARYMRRYAETAKLRLTLSDRAGATYFECALVNGRGVARVRTLDGGMMPLSGARGLLPDSLMLNGELTMKVRRFTLGVRNYHAEFVIHRTDRERAWSIVTRREPDWVLPMGTEHLLRTSLHRPFQGNGSLYRIGVRSDTAGGETVLQRRMHLEVQESAILRFIGRLGSTTMSDFAGKAERERDAWLRELFTALGADIRAAAS